jgi:hypothetical protein
VRRTALLLLMRGRVRGPTCRSCVLLLSESLRRGLYPPADSICSADFLPPTRRLVPPRLASLVDIQPDP